MASLSGTVADKTGFVIFRSDCEITSEGTGAVR